MYLAYKSLVGKVEKNEDGEYCFTNLYGDTYVLTEELVNLLDKEFVKVNLVPEVDVDELAKGYQEMAELNLELCE